ncbi:MAG TPA: molybdate ABC transporter substrate-binding protein [Opitutaceae bacterium]|nr:molybdate ABC transporter substrate-binding protein [Opitutaceae bacterium]
MTSAVRYIFRRTLGRCAFALLVGGLATALHAAELTVFAAASLAEALQEIAPAYMAATGDTLRFSFGASGLLARQIKEGAPADVLVSADELRLDQLERAGLLAAGTRRTILANQLVVVVGAEAESFSTPDALASANVRRIAIGEPATVPAGTYAKQFLESTGLWAQLTGKLVPLANVRAVLAAVEAGNADAGFVYRTDALLSKKVRIAIAVPLDAGPRITYPVAALRDSKSPAAAARFVTFLAGPEAQAVFARYGFLPAP